MVRDKAYFISDLHLGAAYIADKHAHEARVVRFLNSIIDDAADLFLLGDVLDYWYEYRTVVPRGYVRFLGALARLADAGVRIHWFVGNHDVWLFDYLRDEVGLTVYTGATLLTIQGRQVLLSHGDDVGRQPAMYRFTRWCFHNRVCQLLYAAIHPRWTWPIATGWSSHNRTKRDRALLQAAALEQSDKTRSAYDHHREFALTHHSAHPQVTAYLFGHLHIAKVTDLADDCLMLHLGDWIRQDTYAVMQHGELSLHRYRPDAPTTIPQSAN